MVEAFMELVEASMELVEESMEVVETSTYFHEKANYAPDPLSLRVFLPGQYIYIYILHTRYILGGVWHHKEKTFRTNQCVTGTDRAP